MAGEIEEHFRLDFKADCFHSGSISFGRYESEAALCWERWSSFSRNRYREELEKCSTPGLVIEKKAYFEAHFKKKGGILGLSSPECQKKTEYRTSDNEKINPSPQFDESVNGSSLGNENAEMQQEFDSSNLDSQIEFLCDGVDNVDSVSEDGKVEEAHRANLESEISTHSTCKIIEKLDGESAELDTSDVSNLTIGTFDDHHEKSDASCNGSSSKEKYSSQAEYTKRRVSIVSQSRRCVVIDKDLGKKPCKTVNNVLMRPKSDNKTSKASAKHKTAKHDQPGKKANAVREIKRGEKESEVFQKLPNRVHQSENRIKAAVSASQPCIKQESSRFRFQCNERAGRRREFDIKIEERMHAKKTEVLHQLQAKTRGKREAEIKQRRERLNFKATPLPSFYLRDSDKNKIKPSRTGCRASESSRLSSKSSKYKIDPPQASGGTSCHSTVTSDSSPSSPVAEISNQVGLKKEKHKDKIMSLPKHKMMDVKPKKRTVRAS